MKKFRLVSIALFLILSLCISPAYAVGITFDNLNNSENIINISVISDSLSEYMNVADENELIPVTIQLNDNIDLQEVERFAITRAEISTKEMAIMSAETYAFSEVENETHQMAVMNVQDRIAVERNTILKEYYNKKNYSFISSLGLSENQIGSVGIFTPFIRDVLLTSAQIRILAQNKNVCYIDYLGNNEGVDFDTISNTYKIINGDVFENDGYTGVGIRVGLVESGHPKLSVMGADSANIIKTDSNSETDHATMTSGIIKKMAPSCSIYSRSASGLSDAIADCSTLINTYNVHVINISYGAASSGVYNSYSREMDILIKNTGVPIVVASGNGTSSSQYINYLGLGANVITVGAVTSSGTNQAASNAYSLTSYSLYRESSDVINKPDVCAPGKVSIYSYPESEGTSFAAPHVTGTIVQMIARNSGLRGKPETLKAALMASASYNAGSSMAYVSGTKASNQEGAGVIDAGFCYQVARNGRRTHFDATSDSTSFTYDIYCDYTTIPFRIACAWDVLSTSSETSITDFDMRVYKDGALVASSVAFANSYTSGRSNYEIIELSTSILSTYGAGYYKVEITKCGPFYGSGSVRIGLAWEQR